MPYTSCILFIVDNIYMLFALSNVSAWDAASMHHCFGCQQIPCSFSCFSANTNQQLSSGKNCNKNWKQRRFTFKVKSVPRVGIDLANFYFKGKRSGLCHTFHSFTPAWKSRSDLELRTYTDIQLGQQLDCVTRVYLFHSNYNHSILLSLTPFPQQRVIRGSLTRLLACVTEALRT